MTNQLQINDGTTAAVQTIPLPPFLPPVIAFSLEDRSAEFIHDGSPPWTAARAVMILGMKGVDLPAAEQALADISQAAVPVSPEWLIDRLTLLWSMFMATRQSAGNQSLVTVWLGENTRLLSDLPHDIVAAAIDDAVKDAHHGFIPSVGEIRAKAQPMNDGRSRQVERLTLAVDLMRSGDGRMATAKQRSETQNEVAE